MKSYVYIKDAPKMDYMKNFVALPRNYGSKAYFQRKDIQAIRNTVYEGLNDLDAKTHFTDRLKDDFPVLIKPNLVSVYHNTGLDEKDYPESTDPRVFEAVVSWLKQYTNDITIIESSGKPMPTKVSFRTAGYDKIAKQYDTKIVAMELCPVERYLLPKAEVMKEIYLPEVLKPVVDGEAFYVSVPKMKTNLYTGVTLGFKNAMGTIPYYLRERNHNYDINKKLADMLYLFRPDLTVIDGIIGGEGNTPAPVDPVKVGKIVVSNNSVEADRITTYMMGFDPNKNELLLEADYRGFGDPDVEIIGDTTVTKFRPAMTTFFDEKTAKDFPNLIAVAGYTFHDAPVVTDPDAVTPEIAFAIEQACHGGCLAAAKSGLEYLLYRKKSDRDFKLCVIEGPGIPINGKQYWFDRTGKPYTKEDLAALDMPKFGMGDCALSGARDICQYKADGCCDPANNMTAIIVAAGQLCPIFLPSNRGLLPTGIGMIDMIAKRVYQSAKGTYVDVPRHHENKIYEIPTVVEGQSEMDWLEYPLPKIPWKERPARILDQFQIVWSALKY